MPLGGGLPAKGWLAAAKALLLAATALSLLLAAAALYLIVLLLVAARRFRPAAESLSFAGSNESNQSKEPNTIWPVDVAANWRGCCATEVIGSLPLGLVRRCAASLGVAVARSIERFDLIAPDGLEWPGTRVSWPRPNTPNLRP
jgi:hypothetical protein